MRDLVKEKTLSLILNTQATNATYSAANNTATFTMNLGSYLDTDYRHFQCEFVFLSEPVVVATGTPEVGYVNLNFANANVISGQSKQQNIGIIYPIVNTYGGNSYFTYKSDSNDNLPFTIDSPYSLNQIIVSLKRFNNSTVLGAGNTNAFPNWTIILKITPFENEG
jgi:hypothetical protein